MKHTSPVVAGVWFWWYFVCVCIQKVCGQ